MVVTEDISIGPTNKIRKIKGVTVTIRLFPLFISSMRVLSAEIKSTVYGTASFTTTASSLADQTVLHLRVRRHAKQVYFQTQLVLASGSLPLSRRPQMMLWLTTLEDVFVYRGSEQEYGHNPELRVGRIPPRDKYFHKLNNNLEVCTLLNVPIYRIHTGIPFAQSPKFIINSSKCKRA